MKADHKLSFLCIGSSSYDVYLRNVADLTPVCTNPEDCFYNIHLGDKIYVNQVDFMTGGGASNASVTFARGGQKSYFMGLIGCDTPGSACLATFAEEGVDTKYVSYSKRYHTDYSTLLLAPSGERSILTHRGCGAHVKPSHFDLDRVSEPINWIYMTSMVGHFEIYRQIVRQARRRRIKIAFNPGGVELDHPDELRKLLPNIEILSVNKEEAQKIVSGETMPELLKGLRELCPVVIITDGVNGAVLADRTEAIWAGLYHPEHVSVDRTGAGDSFCSGFTLQYALGEGLRRSVHYATANSASVVVRIGSKPGILRGDNIDQLDPIEITPLDLTAG